MVVIDENLPDGSGIELARRLCSEKSSLQVVVLSDKPSVGCTIEAIRTGIVDILVKPLDIKEVRERLRLAIARQHEVSRNRQRAKRLRRVCKKLNRARQDVARQVDVLCNDLVSAYHELASQMQVMVQTSEFNARIQHELDLEAVLRRTLEFVLEKAGPTNAAIYLPSTGDEYSLGGYVNYDCTVQGAELLLQHLGDVAAPKVVARGGLVHITDNKAMKDWLGDQSDYLVDQHLLAFPTIHKDETLAVLVLFRDKTRPFSATLVDACNIIAPLLAQYLAKLIRIHHRHLPDLEDDEDQYDSSY
jgi:FixJ family two-component response regulator